VLQITRIRVTYRLKVPEGTREAAERALEAHVSGCPVAQTLLPCVKIDWDAEIEEV
jgi:uncharacterized OsmC-like protein